MIDSDGRGFFLLDFYDNLSKIKGTIWIVRSVRLWPEQYGCRYFLNLSSPSKLLDSSSDLIPANDFLKEIPAGYDIPYKGMLILIEKHSELNAIIFRHRKT